MPTLAKVRAYVQVRLNDMDAKRGSFDVIRYDHAIADAALLLQSKIPAPHLYLPSAFTIAAQAETFTLPTAAQSGYASLTQYAGEIKLRLTNRRHFMVKRSTTDLDRLREYWTQPVTGAWPEYFALWEEMDNDMQGRCWPAATVAEPCDIFAALMPDDLRDAADMDAANVRFSRYGVAALVGHAAAVLLIGMSDEDAKLRKLDKSAASQWMRDADVLLYQEAARRDESEARAPGSDNCVAAGVN